MHLFYAFTKDPAIFGSIETTEILFLLKLLGALKECTVLFCSLAVINPRVGHTIDVLSPFISILCHFD